MWCFAGRHAKKFRIKPSSKLRSSPPGSLKPRKIQKLTSITPSVNLFQNRKAPSQDWFACCDSKTSPLNRRKPRPEPESTDFGDYSDSKTKKNCESLPPNSFF